VLIEYRYKWHISIKSFTKKETIEEVIDWLERFQNKTLEDHTVVDSIEEIRITLEDEPIVKWIQIHRRSLKYWNIFDIELIINDYPLATIHNFGDLLSFLKFFIKEK